MRRPVAAAAAGLTLVIIALSLHTLPTALGGDETQTSTSIFASPFTSPIDPPYSKITGTVFGDTDGDAKKNLGEPGIPDVTVKLSNSYTDMTTTDSSGVYTFTVTLTDHYTVTATTPPGYVPTTDESHDIEVISQDPEVYSVDFGYRFTLYLPLIARNRP